MQHKSLVLPAVDALRSVVLDALHRSDAAVFLLPLAQGQTERTAVISRVVAPYPRLRAIVEAVAALGPDVLRAALQLARALTGKPLPSIALDSRDAELARLRETVAHQAALLASVSDGARERHPSLPRVPAVSPDPSLPWRIDVQRLTRLAGHPGVRSRRVPEGDPRAAARAAP